MDDPGGPPPPPRSTLEGGRATGLNDDSGFETNMVAIARLRSDLAEWGGHMGAGGLLIRTKGKRTTGGSDFGMSGEKQKRNAHGAVGNRGVLLDELANGCH